MTATRAPHLESGNKAEEMACATLKTRGWNIVQRNYRCPLGEIDLICEDGNEIVFVEVRYRRNRRYGSAAETVDARKQTKIIRAAQHFLQRHRSAQNRPMRFDVVAIHGHDEQMTFDWIPDAFQL